METNLLASKLQTSKLKAQVSTLKASVKILSQSEEFALVQSRINLLKVYKSAKVSLDLIVSLYEIKDTFFASKSISDGVKVYNRYAPVLAEIVTHNPNPILFMQIGSFDHHLTETVSIVHSEILQRGSILLNGIMKGLNWPDTPTSAYVIDFNRDSSGFLDLFHELSAVDPTIQNETLKYISNFSENQNNIVLAYACLTSYFILPYRFHFSGSRPTNRLDKVTELLLLSQSFT